MLNRDFSKSNKEYLNKNKFVLIAVAVFLLVGVIMAVCLGFNTNFELRGYKEFTVNVTEKQTSNNSNIETIRGVLNAHGGKCDIVSISGEGDNSQYVVRYLKDFSQETIIEVNELIAEKLEVETTDISEHLAVKPMVKATDYIYTATAIVLLITLGCIFAYFRYNAASALTLIISCVFGTLSFMCIGAILRLSIGMSYFAMLVILNVLIAYVNFDIFENMRETSWLGTGDYKTALESALKASRFRLCAIFIGLMVLGVVFVLTSYAIKYVSLNILFIPVVLACVAFYVVPFVWSMFITIFKQRKYTVKVTNETKDDNK